MNVKICPTCRGEGKAEYDGIIQECRTCVNGSGKIPDHPGNDGWLKTYRRENYGEYTIEQQLKDMEDFFKL